MLLKCTEELSNLSRTETMFFGISVIDAIS